MESVASPAKTKGEKSRRKEKDKKKIVRDITWSNKK
jgi:hypothetical protein